MLREEVLYLTGKEYIGTANDGRQVRIEENFINQYINKILELILINPREEINTLSILYVLDQDIFKTGHFKTRHGIQNDVTFEDILKMLKTELRVQTLNDPDSITELIKESKFRMAKSHKEYETNKKFIEYILQLLDERVISEKCVINSNILEELHREDLVDLYRLGRLPVSLILNAKSLKSLGKDQLEELTELNFFNNATVEQLIQLKKNGFLNDKGVIILYNSGNLDRETMCGLLGGTENIATKYKKAVKNKNKKEAELFFGLLEPEDICELYLDGKLGLKDVEKSKISIDIIKDLPETEFLKFAQKGFPNGITFESDELIEGYINRFSGDTLIALTKAGYIEPEKLLPLINNEVATEDIERAISPENLLEIYTPDIVIELLSENKIGTDFIQTLYKEVLHVLNEEEKAEYMKNIIHDSLFKMEEASYADTMLSLISGGKIPEEYFANLKISENVLMDMYIEESLLEDQAIEYFNKGILSEKAIKIIYGENYDNIIDLIKQGVLSRKAFIVIPKETIEQYLVSGILKVEDIFSAYSNYDILSSQDLGEMFEKYGKATDQRVKIVDLIENNFDPIKLKQLFIFDVLTHSDILELKERGIITKKQSEEISDINREKLYREIFGEDSSIKNLNEDIEENPYRRETKGGKREEEKEEEQSMSYYARKKFFKDLGICDFKDVQGYDIDGRKAPFDGYELIGFPAYGIVVFENFTDAGNATYVMTIQELKSYITKENKDKKSIIFRKSKKALIEDINNGRAVGRRSHTANWGENVISEIVRLSREAKEAISQEKREQLAKLMREEYIKSKTDDPLAAELIRAKADRDLLKEKQEDVIELENELMKATQLEREEKDYGEK